MPLIYCQKIEKSSAAGGKDMPVDLQKLNLVLPQYYLSPYPSLAINKCQSTPTTTPREKEKNRQKVQFSRLSATTITNYTSQPTVHHPTRTHTITMPQNTHGPVPSRTGYATYANPSNLITSEIRTHVRRSPPIRPLLYSPSSNNSADLNTEDTDQHSDFNILDIYRRVLTDHKPQGVPSTFGCPVYYDEHQEPRFASTQYRTSPKQGQPRQRAQSVVKQELKPCRIKDIPFQTRAMHAEKIYQARIEGIRERAREHSKRVLEVRLKRDEMHQRAVTEGRNRLLQQAQKVKRNRFH